MTIPRDLHTCDQCGKHDEHAVTLCSMHLLAPHLLVDQWRDRWSRAVAEKVAAEAMVAHLRELLAEVHEEADAMVLQVRSRVD